MIENDEAAAAVIYGMLKPGGKLLATVPALMSMWSYNDVLNHHYRRYEFDDFLRLIKNAGFKVELISFYNSKLFWPAFLVRKAKNALRIKSSDVGNSKTGGALNQVLKSIFVSEIGTIKKTGYRRGVSLILVAKK